MSGKTGPDPRMRGLDERESYNLARLRERLNAPSGSVSVTPQAVGEALPEAVLISAGSDQRLPKSMVATTERSIELSIQSDPSVLATALFPIIGSAIRKAIEKLVAETLVNMNAGLEKTLSPQRIAWRIEALRSGVPYFEIVLRNTLEYRVERVFLIHKKASLLLASVSRPGSTMADEDMVASMLTAIQDYIKDSLALDKGEVVDSLKAGEFSILVEEGPLALVALILRGTPDPSIRNLLQDAVETVHLRFGPAFRDFDGDVGAFEEAASILRSCLASQEKGGRKKAPVYAFALLGLLAAATIFFVIQGAREAGREGAFLAALEAEPGIVVVEARRAGGKLAVRLLRDPLAREVGAVVAEHPVSAKALAFDVEEYAALEPRFVLERLQRLLSPPTSIRLSYAEGRLTVEGDAPAAWRAEKLPLAYALAGVDSIGYEEARVSAPAAAERVLPAELRTLAERLASRSLLFDKDSGRMNPGQGARIEEIGTLLRGIIVRAKEASFEARIEVIGHVAGAVRDAESDRVSAERAQEAFALFARNDPSLAPYLQPRGAGNAEPLAPESTEEGKARNRSVSFRATFR